LVLHPWLAQDWYHQGLLLPVDSSEYSARETGREQKSGNPGLLSKQLIKGAQMSITVTNRSSKLVVTRFFTSVLPW
jgi:hypothetical protein